MAQSGLSLKAIMMIVVRSVVAMGLILALLLLTAGRWDFWQAWVYVALSAVMMLLMGTVLTPDKSLMEERLKPKGETRGWDRFFFYVSTSLYVITLVLAALDARFGWSGSIPVGIYLAGVAIYIAGQGIFQWARYTNRFFSSVVRIQTDRGHTVCSEGPYRYVRHPGYVGGILYTAPVGLMLGSWWAGLPQLLAVLMLVWRTGREDRVLHAELAGYTDYARDTRWKLLPGVW